MKNFVDLKINGKEFVSQFNKIHKANEEAVKMLKTDLKHQPNSKSFGFTEWTSEINLGCDVPITRSSKICICSRRELLLLILFHKLKTIVKNFKFFIQKLNSIKSCLSFLWRSATRFGEFISTNSNSDPRPRVVIFGLLLSAELFKYVSELPMVQNLPYIELVDKSKDVIYMTRAEDDAIYVPDMTDKHITNLRLQTEIYTIHGRLVS